MSWQLLIGLSVVLYSINGLLHRTIMKEEDSDAYAQAVVFCALSCLIFLVVFLFRGNFRFFLSRNQLFLTIIGALLSSAGMVFTFKGFKSIGGAEHTILLTSCQLWNMVGAILFLKESLTVTKLAGTAAILGGIVFANWNKRTFKLNKGAIFVLLAAFCFACSGIISFSIVRNFDVLSYMLYGSIFITLILIIGRPKVIKKFTFYFKPKRALNIITASINDSLANILGYAAYQTGRNALQIGPLSATQTIITVLLAIIILKEKNNMPQKIIGSLVVVIGTMLLLY